VFVFGTVRWNPKDRRIFMACSAVAIVILLAVALFTPALTRSLVKLWYGPPGIAEYFHLSVAPRATALEAGYYTLLFCYQFPSLALILGAVGIRTLARDQRIVAALLLLILLTNAGIFIRQVGFQSRGTTKFVFYITDYVMFSIFVAAGAEELIRQMNLRYSDLRASRQAIAVLGTVMVVPMAVYAFAPSAALAAERHGIDVVESRKLPHRNDERFFLNPNKRGENGARQFAQEAFQTVAPAGVVFADYTPGAVLSYLQTAEHVRPDVQLRFSLDSVGRVPVAWAAGPDHERPVYLASWSLDDYDLTGLEGGYDLVPSGPIVEVRPRRDYR
jgi:hypothetical protein